MKLFSKLNLSRSDLVLILGFFLFNSFLQLVNLRYVASPYTDEGNYLYHAKLISQGYLPYRDFMLSHPPLTMFLIAIFFKLFGINLFLLRTLYALFVQSIILPIYILVRNCTKSIWPAIISVALISTFVEFIHHDARFFALRQCELILLAYAIFFLLISKGRVSQFICGLLLGLGLMVTLAHIFVLLPFFIAVYTLHKDSKFREIIFQHRYLLLGFFASLIPLMLTFLIPGAWNCLIEVQQIRPRINLGGRISILSGVIINDPFIFAFGLIGSLFLDTALNRIAATINILALFFITFLPNSLYPHYYVILGPTLAISAGILFVSCLKKRKVLRIVCFLIVFLLFKFQFISKLKYELLVRRSPEYYELIRFMKSQPGKLFTVEPIYALDAGKNIPYHYFIGEPRVLRVLGRNLSYEEYKKLIDESSLVLIEDFANWFFPREVRRYIDGHFEKAFSNSWGTIYIHKGSK